jgi:hypothetical protein
MRLADGTYECTLCGAVLDVPAELTAKVEDAELGGSRDRIVVDGIEIHHCQSPQESGAVMLSLLLALPVPGLLFSLAACV